jgi:hypothetical protein
MTTDHRAALANIKRFDQLIAYLRDEMAGGLLGTRSKTMSRSAPRPTPPNAQPGLALDVAL